MLERTTLVQRLCPPIEQHAFDDYAFTIGAVNVLKREPLSGFKREVYDRLNTAFSFAYMDNALFECGNLPKAFEKMVDGLADDPLQVAVHTVTFKPNQFEAEVMRMQAKEMTLYVLAGSEKQERATVLISDQQKPMREREFRLEEDLEMKKGTSFVGRDVQGWFEMDNGFFIFSNYDMFDKTARLFGVAHDIAAPLPV